MVLACYSPVEKFKTVGLLVSNEGDGRKINKKKFFQSR